MKPRCRIHNRALRWLPSKRAWVCRLHPCETIDKDSPPPKLKRTKKRLRIIYRDGREVLSGAAWRERKMHVFLLDDGSCRSCGKFLMPPGKGLANEAEIHHVHRRGMSGGRRDDRIWVTIDGRKVRNLVTLCAECHRKAGPEPNWSVKEKR